MATPPIDSDAVMAGIKLKLVEVSTAGIDQADTHHRLSLDRVRASSRSTGSRLPCR